jgi:hypothetical protein
MANQGELVAVQLPFSELLWSAMGGHRGETELLLNNGVGLRRGERAWAWRGHAPSAGVDSCAAVGPGARRVTFGIDHVVLLVPDLAAFARDGAPCPVRRQGTVQGRKRAFYVCGPAVLEAVEEPSVQTGALFGLCLDVADVLSVATEWSGKGLELSAVHAAEQDKKNRVIFNLRKQGVGLAVITRRKSKSKL